MLTPPPPNSPCPHCQTQTPPPSLPTSPGPCREGNKSQGWPALGVVCVKSEGVVDLQEHRATVGDYHLPAQPGTESPPCAVEGKN